MSEQYALAARRANSLPGCIRHSTANQLKGVIVPLHLASVWPYLEYCVRFWAPQYEDIEILERNKRW